MPFNITKINVCLTFLRPARILISAHHVMNSATYFLSPRSPDHTFSAPNIYSTEPSYQGKLNSWLPYAAANVQQNDCDANIEVNNSINVCPKALQPEWMYKIKMYLM